MNRFFRRLTSLPRKSPGGWVILIMTLILFGPLLNGQVLFERDVYHLWHGQMEGIVRAVAEGGLPLWDPTVSFGEPLMELAAQLLYPFTWVGMVLSAGTYYSLSVMVHHVFGGVGMLLLLKALGTSESASLLGTVLWMSSGPWLSTANMLNLFTGTSWLPWMMLAAERTATHPTVRSALWWGSAVAACLLTCSEPVFMGGVLAGIWYVFRSRQLGRRIPQTLALSALALLAALLLSAGQWFPLTEGLVGTARAGLDHRIRTYWSLHPLLLLQVAFPLFYRNLPIVWTAEFDDFSYPLLYSVFAGVGPIALAGVAMAGRRRSREWVLGAVGMGCVFFALGRYSPAYDLIASHAPILGSLRFPVKTMLLASFVLSLLAALGLDRAPSATRHLQAMVGGLLGGLVVLAFIGVLLLRPLLALEVSEKDALWGVLGFLPTWAWGIALIYCAPKMESSWWRRVVVLASVACPPIYAHARLNALAPEALLTFRPKIVEAFHEDGGRRFYFRVRDKNTPLVINLDRKAPPGYSLEVAVALSVKQILPPTASRIFGIRSSFEEDIKNIQTRYIRQFSQLVNDVHGTPGELRIMQAAGVTHMITLDTKGTEKLKLVYSEKTLMGDMVYMYRVPDPLPWCFVVDGTKNLDNHQAAMDLAFSTDDRRRIALAPEIPPRKPSGERSGTCVVELDASARTTALITTPNDGLAVFLDAWAPGWTATLDGQAVPVLRANFAFRGVEVKAGTHRVELRYQPVRLYQGLGISAIALVLVLAGIVASEKLSTLPLVRSV